MYFRCFTLLNFNSPKLAPFTIKSISALKKERCEMASLRISEHSSELVTSYLPAFESVFALGEAHPNYKTI